MPQDGLLDSHQVLPCQDHPAGQAGVNPGNTGEQSLGDVSSSKHWFR